MDDDRSLIPVVEPYRILENSHPNRAAVTTEGASATDVTRLSKVHTSVDERLRVSPVIVALAPPPSLSLSLSLSLFRNVEKATRAIQNSRHREIRNMVARDWTRTENAPIS